MREELMWGCLVNRQGDEHGTLRWIIE